MLIAVANRLLVIFGAIVVATNKALTTLFGALVDVLYPNRM